MAPFLFLVLAATAPLQGAEGVWTEKLFYRIHLKNGNFLDGQILSQTPRQVTLRFSGGELSVRRDLIDRVEHVKTRGVSENNGLIDKESPPSAPAPAPAPDSRKVPPIPVTPAGADDTAPDPSEAPTLKPETLKQLEDILARADSLAGERRAKTLSELHELGDDVSVYLACRLGEMEPRRIETAADAIGHLRWTRSLPFLIRQLSNSKDEVRRRSARALGAWGDRTATPAIGKLLKDPNDLVRAEAVTAWAILRPEGVLLPLAEAVLDPSVDVRARAVKGFFDVADIPGNFDDALLRLTDVIQRAPTEAQVRAIEILGRPRRKEIWKLLAELSRSSELSVRYAVVSTIVGLELPEAGPTVVALIRGESDKSMRIQLISAARVLKLRDAIEPLIGWLSDPAVEIQIAANQGLRALTGVDLGRDQTAWEAWWEKNRPPKK